MEKETLTQMFSCEFCKIFKNTFFTEHLRNTASVSRTLDINFPKHSNIIILGYFNASVNEEAMKNFCPSYGLSGLIKQPICFNITE